MKKLFSEQFKGWRATEACWLLFSVSAIIAISLFHGDGPLGIIAAATGMIYTVLAGKGKVSCFVFGIVNTPIYACLAFSSGYYGDAALNAFYFVMMFAGMKNWLGNRSADAEEGIKRTKLTPRGRIVLAALSAAAVIPLWAALDAAGGTRPFCDAMTNVLSVAAMLLTVRRAIEEWILWIAVNSIEIFMWYKAWSAGEGPFSILLMWTLFLVNGIYLFSLWLRIERRDRKRAETPAV